MQDRRDLLRQEYAARINRVIDYITGNLNGDLRLEKLARVANFSPFHFHRIFTGMVGETLNNFIRRVRVEAAASKLINNPKLSITRIAFDCGFSSSSVFAREFREHFGMTATEFRHGSHRQWRKIRQAVSKDGQAISKDEKDTDRGLAYTGGRDLERRVVEVKMSVEVKELPEMQVAYLRHVGPYAGDTQLFESLIGRLMNWAGPRGLLRFPETKMLTVYHDDPNITPEDKLRISVCVTVPEDTSVEGEVGKMAIPGGKFAVAHAEIDPDQYGDVWERLFSEWFPESGYQPDDSRMCYELYLNDPKEHPKGKHIVDICEPVRPL